MRHADLKSCVFTQLHLCWGHLKGWNMRKSGCLFASLFSHYNGVPLIFMQDFIFHVHNRFRVGKCLVEFKVIKFSCEWCELLAKQNSEDPSKHHFNCVILTQFLSWMTYTIPFVDDFHETSTFCPTCFSLPVPYKSLEHWLFSISSVLFFGLASASASEV